MLVTSSIAPMTAELHEKFAGFDWLRVFYTLCVLLMHTNAAQAFSAGFVGISCYDWIQYNLLCLAVPGFLLISNFLTLEKCKSSSDFISKIKASLGLYAFWVAAWILVTKSTPELSLQGVIVFFMRGGGWAYYFFFAYFFTNLLCWGICNWSNKKLVVFLTTALFLVFTSFLVLRSYNDRSGETIVTYWWPISFIGIPFVASLFVRYKNILLNDQRIWFIWMVTSLLLYAFFAVFEWRFANLGTFDSSRSFLPEYLRVSLLFGTSLLLLFSLRIKNTSKLIHFLSKNSLGIFCFHVFWLGGLHKFSSRIFVDDRYSAIATAMLAVVAGSICAEGFRYLIKFRLV